MPSDYEPITLLLYECYKGIKIVEWNKVSLMELRLESVITPELMDKINMRARTHPGKSMTVYLETHSNTLVLDRPGEPEEETQKSAIELAAEAALEDYCVKLKEAVYLLAGPPSPAEYFSREQWKSRGIVELKLPLKRDAVTNQWDGLDMMVPAEARCLNPHTFCELHEKVITQWGHQRIGKSLDGIPIKVELNDNRQSCLVIYAYQLPDTPPPPAAAEDRKEGENSGGDDDDDDIADPFTKMVDSENSLRRYSSRGLQRTHLPPPSHDLKPMESNWNQYASELTRCTPLEQMNETSTSNQLEFLKRKLAELRETVKEERAQWKKDMEEEEKCKMAWTEALHRAHKTKTTVETLESEIVSKTSQCFALQTLLDHLDELAHKRSTASMRMIQGDYEDEYEEEAAVAVAAAAACGDDVVEEDRVEKWRSLVSMPPSAIVDARIITIEDDDDDGDGDGDENADMNVKTDFAVRVTRLKQQIEDEYDGFIWQLPDWISRSWSRYDIRSVFLGLAPCLNQTGAALTFCGLNETYTEPGHRFEALPLNRLLPATMKKVRNVFERLGMFECKMDEKDPQAAVIVNRNPHYLQALFRGGIPRIHKSAFNDHFFVTMYVINR